MRNILMIDIETTGNKPGCKVLSLGAFGFNERGQQVEFYKRFNVEAMKELRDDPVTMDWWSHQDEAVKAEAFGGSSDPLTAITEFQIWFGTNFSLAKNSWFSVWCCGVDFDFPILHEFFRYFGTSAPWKFWHQCDYRTIKNIFRETKNFEGNVEKHNALEDAKAQMRGLRHFWKTHIDNV